MQVKHGQIDEVLGSAIRLTGKAFGTAGAVRRGVLSLKNKKLSKKAGYVKDTNEKKKIVRGLKGNIKANKNFLAAEKERKRTAKQRAKNISSIRQQREAGVYQTPQKRVQGKFKPYNEREKYGQRNLKKGKPVKPDA